MRAAHVAFVTWDLIVRLSSPGVIAAPLQHTMSDSALADASGPSRHPASLPWDVIPRILGFCDLPTLASCLQVSHSFFHLTSSHLYATVDYDPHDDHGELIGCYSTHSQHMGVANDETKTMRTEDFFGAMVIGWVPPSMWSGRGSMDSFPSKPKDPRPRMLDTGDGNPGVSETKSAAMRHTTQFTLHFHNHDIFSPHQRLFASPPMPQLDVLRLVLDPWHWHNRFCYGPGRSCPLLENLQPRTLVLEDVYSLTSQRPVGIAVDNSFPLPNDAPLNQPRLFSKAETVVLKPTTYQTWLEDLVTFITPMFVQQLPSSLKQLVVIFETLPDETWPRHNTVPNERLLPSPPSSFDVWAQDLADVVRPSTKTQYLFVNAGRVDSELMGLGAVGVKDMQNTVEQAVWVYFEMRQINKAAWDAEDRVRFLTMEEYLRAPVNRGVLSPAVADTWEAELSGIDRHSRSGGDKELAVIEGFAVSLIPRKAISLMLELLAVTRSKRCSRDDGTRQRRCRSNLQAACPGLALQPEAKSESADKKPHASRTSASKRAGRIVRRPFQA